MFMKLIFFVVTLHMENIDLNLENYSLEDILQLFKLPYHFTEDHLKKLKNCLSNSPGQI